MNVLIVYAHPNPESFNNAILKAFTSGLKENGHSFETVDLYGMQFDPILSRAELVSQLSGAPLPQEVQQEQEKVRVAMGLVFIYPIWWYRAPAVLEGWIDRVLAPGCAYQFTEDGIEGMLQDKKVLIINTAMGSAEAYRSGDLSKAMKRISGAVFTEVCGVKDVKHLFFYSVHDVDDKIRQGYLESARSLGRNF